MSFPLHILFGPTASGKSARALALARERNGVVINADATQLYRDLQILSARPTGRDMGDVPHRLYGTVAGNDPASAGRWLSMAVPEIEQAWQSGRLPILCGGTGLYIKALTEGLSPLPDVPAEVRRRTAEHLHTVGHAAFHAELAAIDPAAAARIGPANSHRLIRARELFDATGRTFSDWLSIAPAPPLPQANIRWEYLTPDRAELYRRCDARFDAMLGHGAIEEVATLLTHSYPTDAPVMKAVGVAELTAYLRGELSLEDATIRAKQRTRNYAKRQLTWMRNQFGMG